jgi:hypothetical protein
VRVRILEKLLAAARKLAPVELRRNVSRLIEKGLRCFVAREERRRFAESMATMGRDLQAMALNRQMAEELSIFDNDGLEGV